MESMNGQGQTSMIIMMHNKIQKTIFSFAQSFTKMCMKWFQLYNHTDYMLNSLHITICIGMKTHQRIPMHLNEKCNVRKQLILMRYKKFHNTNKRISHQTKIDNIHVQGVYYIRQYEKLKNVKSPRISIPFNSFIYAP